METLGYGGSREQGAAYKCTSGPRPLVQAAAHLDAVLLLAVLIVCEGKAEGVFGTFDQHQR